jgi:hypothetical protein
VGRASRAKKLRWDERARSAELQTLVSGLKVLGDWRRDRDRRQAEAIGQWWSGDAVPALVPDWPEDSLGDRLFSDELFQSALGVPPLRSAQVPDPSTIRSDPVQWSVAAWVLVRAVVLDGLGVEDPAVTALLAVLATVVEAELAASEAAAVEARRDGLEPGAIAPDFPDEDGPVFVIGCCALVHATWTAIGDDPLAEVLDVVSPLLDSAVPGRGCDVAEALVRAFADHYACERAADVELLERLGAETSGNPLRDLISAGVIAPEDVLRIGLEVLGRLAELCKTSSVSVLDRATSARG